MCRDKDEKPRDFMGPVRSSEKAPWNLGLGDVCFGKVCSGVTPASGRITVAP